MSGFVKLPLAEALPVIGQRLGMSEQDIADELGVQLRAVQRWRTGRHVPLYRTIRPLQALARRANVEIDPGSMVR